VAVKKVFDPVMSDTLLQETRNEIDVLNKLRHPNVVSILGVQWTPPELILIFERMDQSLYKLLHIQKTKLEMKHIKQVLMAIANGINFIHYNGYVHKDIKSHNVLVNSIQEVKICDFGLCHKIADKNRQNFGGTLQ